jgi:hypothetical protein
MSEHMSIERMNEALDGLLSAAEMEPLERHLEGCGACRNEFARLSETIEAVRRLPKAAATPEAAWEGITKLIGGDGEVRREKDVRVYRLPTAGRGAARRVSVTVSQLAAAAALVAFLSAGVVWVAMRGGGPRLLQDVTSVADAPGGAASRAVSLERDRYTEVIDELEQVLEEGRALLAPETLLTIEESLVTVNAAIDDIETALQDDPNSDLLLRLLASHRRTKLGVLQRAAEAVQAQT